MRRRSVVAAMVLAAGSFAGSTLYRRRAARHRAHVDIYREDGTTVCLPEGTADATRVLTVARELLEIAR